MHERSLIWALLATVAIALGACASDCCEACQEECSPSEEARQGVTLAAPEGVGLSGLDAAMAQVAKESVWSYQLAGSKVAVEGAWLDGQDLFLLTMEESGRALHRVEADTGVHRWVLELGDKELSQAPGFGESFVTVVTRDGGIQAVSRRTGARGENQLWGRLGRVIPNAPVVSSDSTLFVPSDGDDRLHALNPNTGHAGWHFRTDGLITAGPLMTPRVPRRLVLIGSSEGEVVALPPVAHDARSPEAPAWQRMVLGEVAGPMAIASRIADERVEVSVLVPCEDKGLYCLDAATGESRWVYRTGHPFRARPAQVGNLVVAKNLHRLAVVDLGSGKDAWKRAAEGEALHAYETYDRALAGSHGVVYLERGGEVARVSAASGHVERTAPLGAAVAFLPSGGTTGLLIGVGADGAMAAWR